MKYLSQDDQIVSVEIFPTHLSFVYLMDVFID